MKTFSSIIHGLLNWNLLFWPHAMPQPGKKINFDHEYQVGYVPCSDCPNAFWKLQWLGPTLWQKSSQVKCNPANLMIWCFPVISYRGSPVLPSQQRQKYRNGGLCLPMWPTSFSSSSLRYLLGVYLTGSSFSQWKELGVRIFGDFLLSVLCQTGLNNGLIKSDLS